MAYHTWGTQAGRDRIVRTVQDLRRSLDYLETRREIDRTAFAYFGHSIGGMFAPLSLALEPRLEVAISPVGGFSFENFELLDEIDPGRFIARVEQAFLMLNGELDPIVPLETHARPFYRRPGTEEQDKKLVIEPCGHFVPRDTVIHETLDWLDRYLGPRRPVVITQPDRPAGGASHGARSIVDQTRSRGMVLSQLPENMRTSPSRASSSART